MSAQGALRPLTRALWRRPRLKLALLLSAPVGWLVVAYLGSLAVLLVSAFWSTDSFTGTIVRQPTTDNFTALLRGEVYRAITLRTVGLAAAVTVIDVVLGFPVAFFMAKVARRRWRPLLLAAVLTPLWASYLVKAYAWRVMVGTGGVLDWALGPLGLHGPGFGLTALWLVLSYLWLPYMILPIFAGLDRLPDSLLEASSDLGAHALRTFRSVVLPMALPAVVAGSIFTFSLTLGDFVAVNIVGGKTQMIGNVIYANVGAANNLPFAAALACVPVVIMVVYLLAARRAGALERL
ncbi:MAG TPA: ABC transporter permease [Actinomycetes bacterium]|nr:ABC transporter permease [Actinomycetes bacterium]